MKKLVNEVVSELKNSARKEDVEVLKKYIVDGVKRDRTCESCGSSEMAYQEGCLTCMSCGYALCG